MDRRRFLAVTSAAALLPALPAHASRIPLNRLSQYLNQLQTAQAKFTQINPDGTVSTGQVFIKRPGRARFEYDPPEETLVMAGGGSIAIFDPKSNLDRPEQYPLRRTPLNIILERNVDLSRRSMVVGHEFDGVATTVVAQDPENPEYGRIELKFTDSPVELRQWIVVDGAGNRTTIVLGEMATGVNLAPTLFNIDYEASRRSR